MPHPTNDKRRWYREEYLKSDHWKELRARKLKANPVCEICKNKKASEPHHVNYRNIFDVELEDLVSVCRDCHKDEHRVLAELKKQEEEKLAMRKKKRELIDKLGYAPAYPIMKDANGMNVVTLRALKKGYTEKRLILEREIGKQGMDLVGCVVPDILCRMVGAHPGTKNPKRAKLK